MHIMKILNIRQLLKMFCRVLGDPASRVCNRIALSDSVELRIARNKREMEKTLCGNGFSRRYAQIKVAEQFATSPNSGA